MKRTMQIFESDDGHEIIVEAYTDGKFWCADRDDYFPVSQPFEVDVQIISDDVLTKKRINCLETDKTAAHAKWLSIAAAFDDRISKLRAIPHLQEDES